MPNCCPGSSSINELQCRQLLRGRCWRKDSREDTRRDDIGDTLMDPYAHTCSHGSLCPHLLTWVRARLFTTSLGRAATLFFADAERPSAAPPCASPLATGKLESLVLEAPRAIEPASRVVEVVEVVELRDNTLAHHTLLSFTILTLKLLLYPSTPHPSTPGLDCDGCPPAPPVF